MKMRVAWSGFAEAERRPEWRLCRSMRGFGSRGSKSSERRAAIDLHPL